MQPPPRTWWERNLKWVIAGAALAFFLLLVVFVGALLFAVVSATRSSDVFQTALASARAHPEVVARLGEPIEPGLLVQGKIEVTPREGEADLGIPIHGPLGEGEISVVARKRAGVWSYEILEAHIGSQPPIDLRAPAAREEAAPAR